MSTAMLGTMGSTSLVFTMSTEHSYQAVVGKESLPSNKGVVEPKEKTTGQLKDQQRRAHPLVP